ncbi:MAG: hypothetical protein AB1553_02010 [Nitrospirota bacterium]
MLSLQANVQGDKLVITGFRQLAAETPKAIDRGLVRIAIGVHRNAFEWLSGPGRTAVRLNNKRTVKMQDGNFDVKVQHKTQKRGQFDMLGGRPGSYPVPVLMGNLRNKLNWLRPGASKTADGVTFRAGQHEVINYNSAEYADTIHEGKGSSEKYGKRQYLTDALAKFNSSDGVEKTMDNEVQNEIKKSGL